MCAVSVESSLAASVTAHELLWEKQVRVDETLEQFS